MPVNSEHPQYKIRKDQWRKCRHTIAGSDTIKKHTTEYLPPLAEQTDGEYHAYLSRALFYGASSRTVQALMGAIFRKPYNVKYPEELEYQLENITKDGKDLDTFVRDVVYEIISAGRVAILPDALKLKENETATTSNARPYLAVYTTEALINWRTMLLEGEEQVIMAVLEESYTEQKQNDEYELEVKTQYRVLRIGMEGRGQGARYQQDVYRKVRDKWVVVPELHAAPVRIGTPLTNIPLEIINTYDLTTDADKPPLLDLIEVNLSHFRTSADLEHGAHYTALPTAWVAGFPKGSKLRIGSSSAWMTEETDAKAGFLEYTGKGLSTLQEIKRDKEQLMAILGARLLEENKKAAEAADTLKIRAASETGSLTAMAKNISSGITEALKTLAWWSGASDQQIEEIAFELNTDFIDTKLSPQEMQALMQLYQGGSISQDTFLYNLKRGEVLPDDVTIDDEKDLIEMDEEQEPDMTNVTPFKRSFSVERDEQGQLVGVNEE